MEGRGWRDRRELEGRGGGGGGGGSGGEGGGGSGGRWREGGGVEHTNGMGL